MLKVVEVADLIRSRFKFFLKEDPVDRIYLDKDNNVICVLYEDLPNDKLTNLRNKYIRALDDHDVQITVLNKTNNWKHDDETGTLYYRWHGFYIVLPPYKRFYEYGAF